MSQFLQKMFPRTASSKRDKRFCLKTRNYPDRSHRPFDKSLGKGVDNALPFNRYLS